MTSPLGEEITKMGKNKKLFLLGILFFSMFALVSAATISSGCCERTIGSNPAWCQDGPANCSSSYGVSLNTCEETDYCQTGYCFDSGQGLCSAGSPKAECENDGGDWYRSYNEEICKEGCCYLRENTQYTTSARCEILGEIQGIDSPQFDLGVSEEECRFYSQNEGACVVGERCDSITEESCALEGGEFYEGVYCSNPELNLSYIEKDHEGCVVGKDDVYWFDDADNKEGVAEACDDGEETCALVSGEYTCKSISCIDDEDNERADGESWCVYDAYVGDSRDVVGSEHCIATCQEGEIKTTCSKYRTDVCAEVIENGTSTAMLRDNLAGECFNIENVEECNLNPDCRVQSVNVGSYFKFDACVPKYPGGFDIYSTDNKENGKDVCNLASLTCNVLWEEDSFLTGSDDCEENCECNSIKFVEQMQNLCVSLGDCGSYVNYVGKGTNNIVVNGQSNIEGMCNDRIKFCSNDPETDGLINGLLYNLCDRKAHSCEDGVYVLTGYPRWQNYISYLTKPNVIGVNTPEFLPRETNARRTNIPESLIKISYPGDPPKTGGDDYYKAVTFTCKPWTPPSSGDDCSKCNENPLVPCTDYRCSSLGSSCEILDETRDGQNICVNRFSNDSIPPDITFTGVEGEDLQDRSYTYSEVGGNIEITTGSGCPQKYSELKFTYETDEIAKCVVLANVSADILQELESENEYFLEHEAEINLGVDDNLRLFVVCQDPSGWYNRDEFIVDICVSPEPDITEPKITKYNPANNGYFKLGATNVLFSIDLNEPADCKYDKSPSVSYDAMAYKMTCNKNQPDIVRRFCQTTLNLVSGENKFYIKCNDTSGNINVNDFVYTLHETPTALVIDSVSPADGAIRKEEVNRENPLTLETKTSGGAYNGVSICRFKFPGQGWSDTFTTTNSTIHKYAITSNLSEGNYTMEITCADKVGNEAKSTTVFFLDIDRTPPAVVRAYYDSGSLILITNEDAKCYYNDINACSPFSVDSLRSMETGYTREHSVAWDKEQTYYIKCIDLNGNPNPSCAIIVKPGE
jgi:hypothetical protein